MKFFTRTRYDAIQGESAAADRDWDLAAADYTRHLARIRDRLPASVQKCCDLSLHDGIVVSVGQPSSDEFEIVIDATRNPWGPRGRFKLSFIGVTSETLQQPSVQDWWLYEEWHLSDAGFALHVLFEKSELLVEASALAFESLNSAR